MSAEPSGPVRMLAVCTGNISRSPAVERLLRNSLGDAVHARSAGVMAVVGDPIDPPVATWLGAQGVEVSGFAARQLDGALVAEAELVLALTRAHRARVLELAPGAVRRTFTLTEFARLLTWIDLAGLPGGSTAERLRAAIPLVTAGRALAPRAVGDGDDVPDPFGGGADDYARSLELIAEAVTGIVRRVTG